MGTNAKADSGGPGSLAVAVGNPGYNPFYRTNLPTHSVANGINNVSLAFGDGSNAGTLGHGNTALVLGNGSNAFSYGGNTNTTPAIPLPGRGNTSVTLAHGSEAGAVGDHKVSTAFSNGKQRKNNGLGG